MDEDDAAHGARSLSPGRGAGRPGVAVGLGDSARLALWFSAWCAGTASLDEARDAVVGDDAAHDVVGLPGRDEPVPLILALGALRAERATAAGLALPEPGDPLGLGGPAAFNSEALEVGEAVVLDGADLGLVPFRAGAGVVWRCLPASSRRQLPDLGEADTGLRRALPAVADELAALDVGRWRPEVADELMALRRPTSLAVPPGTGARQQRMLALAARCRTIVELALEDDGGAVTASEADRRRAALLPLDRAARRAVVAACSHPFDR
ncbi:hypothetical protein [Nocardioides caldifontis]|uniref:hypothetical protein n=1 Tax=Nocardioides caldifontis TaxID=2588938 RepID=UPI001EF0BC7E|nr:hypothetical protein [Nocardioides caldifontis]